MIVHLLLLLPSLQMAVMLPGEKGREQLEVSSSNSKDRTSPGEWDLLLADFRFVH